MSALLSLFANPAFLPGLLAASVPVAIHLLSKRRAPRIEFPTLRFLSRTAERTASRRRIEEIILLVLRATALGLAAVALSQPTIENGRMLASSGGGSTLILLDTSLSMSQDAGRVSAFEHARRCAERITQDMPSGCRMAVWLTCGQDSDVPLRRLQARKTDQVVASLQSLNPTAGAGELSPSLGEAVRILRTQSSATRELIVLTDGQSTEWRALDETIAALGHGEEVRLFVYIPQDAGGENVAVESVSLSARAPLPGEEARLRITARGYGKQEMRSNINVYVDGVLAARKAITIPPEGIVNENQSVPLIKPGWLTGMVQLDTDKNPRDNRAYFAIEIKREIRALLVKTGTGKPGRDNASFYLSAALAPHGPSAIRPETVSPEALSATDLRNVDTLFILGVPDLNPMTTEPLRRWTLEGGTLVFIPDERVKADTWNTIFGSDSDARGGLLPAILTDPASPVDPARPQSLVPDAPGHPLVAGWKTIARQSLRRVSIKRHFGLSVDSRSPSRIAIALDDGEPFLITRRYGRGHTVLWAAPPQTDWMNLQARPIFVPLVHAHAYLGLEINEGATSTAGARWLLSDFPSPRSTEAVVTPPKGDPVRLKDEQAWRENPLLYADTWREGLYTLELTQPETRTRIAAVNPAGNAEGDLALVDERLLQKRLRPVGPVSVSRTVDDLTRAITASRQDLDLMDPLLTAVFVLLIAESLYGAHRTRHAAV